MNRANLSPSDPNRYLAHIEWERTLKVGDAVEARWTNCGHEWRAKATVKKLNEKSVRVVLAEKLPGFSGVGEVAYPVGQEITCPRTMALDKHSVNNCVVPLSRPESAGPSVKRGDEVEGGKIGRIFIDWMGYTYDVVN
jgi:hypothetical protein